MAKNAHTRFGSAIAAVILTIVCASQIVPSAAQERVGRIKAEIDNSARMKIAGTHPVRANQRNEIGRVPASRVLHGITLVFSRTAQQEKALQDLIASQQDPASSDYHHWLTPEQFAARFGIADADLKKVEGWLKQQGFSIDSISRSRGRISFSGTVGQVEAAFGTEMHYYRGESEIHFAPASDVSIPAALAPVVQNVSHLSNFRPRARILYKRPRANFTSSQTGNHFLTPKDVATIYDVTPAYNSGLDGAGQSITVVGQSSVDLSDVENFRSAAGISGNDPVLVLVPGSGDVQEFSGDESESDLDLEYSSAMAPAAAVYFVYVGNSTNFSVFDSLLYAVDNRLTPIISISYGICEPALGVSNYNDLNGVLAQAASQGQTVVGPAGDSGSADCSGVSGLTTTQQQALAVDFPASSQYVTAMGGTEFSAQDVAPGSSFWAPANGSDVISSALSYIPEGVWNDNSASGLSSTGGGTSIFTSRPSWQQGNAFPSGSFRLVPDISLTGSPVNAAFLFCSSDVQFTGVTGSCSNGFRDSSNKSLTGGGGTSFDAPIFAGLVAILNESENSTGQGAINQTIYNLAANSTTYSAAFHDVTTGNNDCTAGASLCSGAPTTHYSAGTGYDEASGLGSIDFSQLLNAWPAGSASSLVASKVSLSAASPAPAVGASDTITIAVASASSASTSTPTGTLTVTVDGSVQPAPTLNSGSATFDFTPTSSGSHVIVVNYSGDSTYAPSTSALAVDNQSFRTTATNATIASGSSGTSTITVTPQEGYAGTVQWSVSSTSAVSNVCYSLPNTTVSGSAAVNVSMTINTSSSACAGAKVIGANGQMRSGNAEMVASLNKGSARLLGLGITLPFLFAGMVAWRPAKKLTLAGMLLLVSASLIAIGCGGHSPVPLPNQQSTNKGTYTIVVTGTDTASASISSATTFTLTIN